MRSSQHPQTWYYQKRLTTLPLEWLKRHWHKVLLVGLLLYMLTSKNISIQLKMSGASIYASQLYPASLVRVEEKAVIKDLHPTPVSSSSFSINDILGEMGIQDKQEATPPSGAPDNSPYNFRNLTFVLSPDYAKRKKVPKAVVEEKMAKCNAYVERFAPVAISEMKRYGIPASIKLAQALLESDVGESRLAKNCHNHFGIKCFSQKCKKGHCSNFTDDTHKDFFRIYESDWQSFRAHSVFLQGKRYAHLKKLGSKDYKGWANGLKKAGYATDKNYPQKLISIIQNLNLNRFDQ